MTIKTWHDRDGVRTFARSIPKLGALHLVVGSSTVAALDREQATELRDLLNQHLLDTETEQPCGASIGPVPKLDGEVFVCNLTTGHPAEHQENGTTWSDPPERPDSIALEAHGLVYGDREGDYGHPREDFTRTAILWTGLLQHKLADGEYVTPEDYARCMVAVKLSRDVHAPKRDNRVDMAGYAITLDRLETGK